MFRAPLRCMRKKSNQDRFEDRCVVRIPGAGGRFSEVSGQEGLTKAGIHINISREFSEQFEGGTQQSKGVEANQPKNRVLSRTNPKSIPEFSKSSCCTGSL